jgi:hypothetical protein
MNGLETGADDDDHQHQGRGGDGGAGKEVCRPGGRHRAHHGAGQARGGGLPQDPRAAVQRQVPYPYPFPTLSYTDISTLRTVADDQRPATTTPSPGAGMESGNAWVMTVLHESLQPNLMSKGALFT